VRLEALVGGVAHMVGPDTPLAAVAALMVERSADAVAVVDRGGLIGIFTDHDLTRAASAGADLGSARVDQWMTEAPDVFSPDIDVREAAAWLFETGYGHLPVMAGEDLLGIVSARDLLWAITQD